MAESAPSGRASRSVLIITALGLETNSVLPFLRDPDDRKPDRWGVHSIRGRFAGRTDDWQVAIVEVGRDNESAAVKTALAVPEVKPELIMLIGVAGGLKDVALGDVVVATAVYGYEKGKETDDGFLPRAKVFNSSMRLVEAARHVTRSSAWQERVPNRRVDPRTFVEPIVVGSKVVASERGAVRELLRRSFSDAVAVETVGLGLMAAAHHVDVPAIVFLGVSDLLSNKEETDSHGWQPQAASHASALAFEVLSEVELPRTHDPDEVPAATDLAAQALEIPVWKWRPDLFAPSAMLRPEFGVVPFHGRDEELRDLVEWASADRPLGVRLYTGPGGMGKTRLMIELCIRLGGAGWRAGFLSRELGVDRLPVALDGLIGSREPCLLVVDYAETRTLEVTALLGHVLGWGTDRVCRIVLLARNRGDWWGELQRLPNRLGEVLSGPATTVERLKPLAPDLDGRREVFNSAIESFKRHVDASNAIEEPPNLEARYHERVLYILIAALATVQGESIKDEDGLLDFTLRREQRLLDDGVATPKLEHLKGQPILQAAAVATLIGSAANRAEAARLISAAPLLADESPIVIDTVAELLHRLYPGDAWLEGVLPDLLGEHLVDRVLERDPRLIDHLFGGLVPGPITS